MRTSPRRLWFDLATLLDPAGVHAGGGASRPDRHWRALFRLSAAQLVAPGLYAALVARGQLAQVPSAVGAALEGLYQLNDQRNRRLRTVLHETVRHLNQAGLVPLLLKGAIALLPDQYPHAFARMLGDLDLALADTEEATLAAAVLVAAGYCEAPDTDPTHAAPALHHLPALFHPSGDGHVEIHHTLLQTDRVPPAALSLTMMQAQAQALDWNGVQVRIPSLEHRLLHNALHHQLQDRGFAFDRRSLRQLLEFAQLRALPTAAALDWPALLRHLDRVGAGDAVRGYLLATQGLFGQPLPIGVQPTAAVREAERRFAYRLDHPRLSRWRAWIARLPARLPRLAHRLTTPAWYPEKYRYLSQHWFPARPAPETWGTFPPGEGKDPQA